MVMAMAAPDLSVVITTFNRASRLPGSIGSVLRSGLGSCEVVVVDDGSTDDTADVVATYPAVRYIRQANAGASAARNTGIAAAGGQFVAFLDDDDAFLPGAHQRMVEALVTDPSIDVVFGDVAVNDEQETYERGMRRPVYDPVRLARRREIVPEIWSLDRRAFLDFQLFERNCVLLQAAVFRKALAERMGGLDESLTGYEEWEFFTRLARAGQCAYYDAAVTQVEKHGANMSIDLERMVGNAVTIRESFVRGGYAADSASLERLRRLWRASSLDWALMAFRRGDHHQARRRLVGHARRFGLDGRTAAYLAAAGLPAALVNTLRAVRSTFPSHEGAAHTRSGVSS